MDAGTGVTDVARVAYPIDALVSYHYFREEAAMAPLVDGTFRLIGDSGAYSVMTTGASIALDDYAAWLRRWGPSFCWSASLDVIGDPRASYANWRRLRDHHGLLTVPSLHAGADLSWLDAYGTAGVDLVGLGGLAARGQAPRGLRWAVQVFRAARAKYPAMRFHVWGTYHHPLLAGLPVWSADSSGALGASIRYGYFRVFDPVIGKRIQIAMRDPAELRRVAPLLRAVYGVEPPAVRRIDPTDRASTLRYDVASTQQHAAWLQRRHAVTGPAMSDGGTPPTGTRLHVVAATSDMGRFVEERAKGL